MPGTVLSSGDTNIKQKWFSWSLRSKRKKQTDNTHIDTHTHTRYYSWKHSISDRLSNLPTVTQWVSNQASIHIQAVLTSKPELLQFLPNLKTPLLISVNTFRQGYFVNINNCTWQKYKKKTNNVIVLPSSYLKVKYTY